jgi:3-phosphoshikimate 1-carboxyvinyltransferase
MKRISIIAPKGHIHAQVSLPASKSISNRLLILQAIQADISINTLSSADDTVLMQHALTTDEHLIHLKNAGTCVRFLTAYFAASGKHKIITGDERMKARPIKPLVDALRKMGAEINYLEKNGCIPIEILPRELTGGEVTVDVSQSSQFASALLLISPLLQNGLKLKLGAHIASYPYIQMTIGLLRQVGIDVLLEEETIEVPPAQKPKGIKITTEADWSAASYWYEIAALSEYCEVFLEGLTPNSLQGDAVIADWMKKYFGVESTFENNGIRLTKVKQFSTENEVNLNMQHNPDLAPAVSAAICAAGIKANLYGLQTLALKESDRIAVLSKELSKTGVMISVTDAESMRISPASSTANDLLDMQTSADHRMAMAFAPLSLCFESVKLDDGSCVEKSYPDFWKHLQLAGFSITE